MKPGKIYRFLWAAAVVAVVLFAASCTKETLVDGGSQTDVPEGMVRLEMFIDTGEYEQPATYAADDAMAPPLVFVFQGAGDNAVFREVQQAVKLGSKCYVDLTKRTGAHRLLIVSNGAKFTKSGSGTAVVATPANLTAAGGLTVGSTTLTQAAGILIADPVLTGIPAGLFAGSTDPIPMSAILSLSDGITANTVINNTGTDGGAAIQLRRIAAKVTVNAADAKVKAGHEFTLTGVSVAKPMKQGRWVSLADNETLANPGTVENYTENLITAITADVSAPLYVYESPVGVTSIIVQGNYKGSSYYYRMAFVDPTSQTTIDVRRNKHYAFQITSVTGAGYGTFAEAVAAPVSNVVNSNLRITDLTSHEMIDNGQYYLGVSNSEFIAYSDADLTNVTALTVSTNATTATGITTNSVSASTGITLSQNSLLLHSINVSSTPIAISMAAAVNSGTITVKLGNLVKTITVSRISTPIDHNGKILQFDNCVAGKVESQGNGGSGWLSFSFDADAAHIIGTEITTPNGETVTPSPIYLKIKDNWKVGGNSGIARTGGEVYLTRKNESKRVKIFVEQKRGYVQFALSNIVSVGTAGVDQKLIFAETPADLQGGSSGKNIPANSQGLLFKWGSLVGLSGSGAEDSFNVANDIHYVPAVMSISDWSTIPYYDVDNSDYSATRDEFITMYPSIGYDASAGKGDICRYISAQSGWVSGKWRMPTQEEFKDFYQSGAIGKDVTNYYGVRQDKSSFWDFQQQSLNTGMGILTAGWWFGPDIQTSTPPAPTDASVNAVMFPAAGWRYNGDGGLYSVGSEGNFWSCTPGGSTTGYELYFHSGGNMLNITSRTSGFPVRCVRL